MCSTYHFVFGLSLSLLCKSNSHVILLSFCYVYKCSTREYTQENRRANKNHRTNFVVVAILFFNRLWLSTHELFVWTLDNDQKSHRHANISNSLHSLATTNWTPLITLVAFYLSVSLTLTLFCFRSLIRSLERLFVRCCWCYFFFVKECWRTMPQRAIAHNKRTYTLARLSFWVASNKRCSHRASKLRYRATEWKTKQQKNEKDKKTKTIIAGKNVIFLIVIWIEVLSAVYNWFLFSVYLSEEQRPITKQNKFYTSVIHKPTANKNTHKHKHTSKMWSVQVHSLVCFRFRE